MNHHPHVLFIKPMASLSLFSIILSLSIPVASAEDLRCAVQVEGTRLVPSRQRGAPPISALSVVPSQPGIPTVTQSGAETRYSFETTPNPFAFQVIVRNDQITGIDIQGSRAGQGSLVLRNVSPYAGIRGVTKTASVRLLPGSAESNSGRGQIQIAVSNRSSGTTLNDESTAIMDRNAELVQLAASATPDLPAFPLLGLYQVGFGLAQTANRALVATALGGISVGPTDLGVMPNRTGSATDFGVLYQDTYYCSLGQMSSVTVLGSINGNGLSQIRVTLKEISASTLVNICPESGAAHAPTKIQTISCSISGQQQ